MPVRIGASVFSVPSNPTNAQEVLCPKSYA